MQTGQKGKDGEREDQGDSDEEDTGRLQGFEGSNIGDIRALLDMDAAEAKAEARRERKLKQKAELDGEAPKKELTRADKLNRDFQQFELYQKRRQGGAEATEEEEEQDQDED